MYFTDFNNEIATSVYRPPRNDNRVVVLLSVIASIAKQSHDFMQIL